MPRHSVIRPVTLKNLRSDFVWGTATAAYQIEGGAREGGRGVSIWDTFAHTEGKTRNGDTGDIACDHYHRWAGDLDLMQSLGFPAYRLNFSWVRLQPAGRGELNAEGIEFYRNLIQGCLDRGIRPFVTLYHWDLPQTLQDEGGWPARSTAQAFADYSALVVAAFKDLVHDWITINEAWCVAFLGHSWGVQAPGFTNDRLAIRAMHHVLLGHGLAVKAMRAVDPTLRVGITNILSRAQAYSQSAADLEVTEQLDARMNQITMAPVYLGAYSESTFKVFGEFGLNREPAAGELVQPGDLEVISTPTDFVGVNHYHSMLAQADASEPGGIKIHQAQPNHQSNWGWPNTPDALYEILKRVSAEYSSLPIYITENGITLDDYVDPNGEVSDPDRIDYLNGYINAIGRAAGEGVEVRGYFAWSFMDNFEWAEGYSKRFGLVYIDFATQKRIPKRSAGWYRDLIQEHKKKAGK